MMTIAIICIIILTVILTILIIPLTAIVLVNVGNEIVLKISVGVGKLQIPIRLDSNKEKEKEKEKEKLDVAEKVELGLKKTLHMLEHMLTSAGNHVKIKNLKLDLQLGFGDAAATGTVVGMIWTVITNILNLLSQYFSLEQRDVNITPDFENVRLEGEIKCVVQSQLISLTRMLIEFLKYK